MFIVTGRSIWAVLAAMGAIVGMAFFAGAPFEAEPALTIVAAHGAEASAGSESARLVLRDAGDRLRRSSVDSADDASAREFDLGDDAREEVHGERVRTVSR